jgi:cytochrome P450
MQVRREGPPYLERLAREYGDVIFFRTPGQQVYFLNHPDLSREVLVTQQHQFKKSRILERARVLLGNGLLTSEAQHHRRQRRLVQPAFHRERLESYSATMIERAAAARERWQDGATFDISKEMMRLTLDIVSRTLFSTAMESQAEEVREVLHDAFGLFDMVIMPFSEYLEKLPLPAMRRFYKARADLDRIIYGMIAERRASGKDTGDLLSMLLLAQDEEGEGGMTDEQVRDELLTLFIAGHDTTATALSWTWYLLSQNPDAEAKMHAEIDTVLQGRLPTFDDLAQLRYTNAVFLEGLRMYPPAWAIARRALEDIELGGYLVPKGSIVLLSTYVAHRDPRWFSEPDKFMPERWLVEDETRPRFAYSPFGGGARVCIGERFAGMEGVLLLATIAQKWRFEHVPSHRVEMRAMLVLRPKFGMEMIARRRQTSG